MFFAVALDAQQMHPSPFDTSLPVPVAFALDILLLHLLSSALLSHARFDGLHTALVLTNYSVQFVWLFFQRHALFDYGLARVLLAETLWL